MVLYGYRYGDPGRYTRCAYYEDSDDLYVNLYMPGTYEWEEKGLTFTVETTYPYFDKVQLKSQEQEVQISTYELRHGLKVI